MERNALHSAPGAVVFDHIKVEPKRDRYGRYLINGQPYTRVTTFAGTIDDRHNLEKWQQRMVAVGLTQRPDLYAQVAAHHDDKRRLDQLCGDAIEAAKGSAGANLGTALHAFTERVDLGEPITIPEPWDADIAAYRETMAANGVHVLPEFVEQIVVHHGLGIAGTFDRLVRIDGRPLPVIADLKTGSIDHSLGGIAIQLACYANAEELYNPVADLCDPMPDVDRNVALIIHLPAGQATCTLHMVDIAAGWEAVQLAARVRDWRKRKQLAVPFESTLEQRGKWLAGRVQTIKDQHPDALQDLAALWPAEVPTFKQGGPRTSDELNLVALAVSTVEAKHRIGFAEPDPASDRPDDTILDNFATRLAVLPAELVERLNTHGLPNIRSRQFTVAHAEQLEPLLTVVEAEHAEMRRLADTYLTGIAGDTAQTAAVIAACGSDGTTWTKQQLEVLGRLADLATDGGLVFVTDDDGQTTVACLDAEQRLVDIYGTKRDALAAVKELADQFGLPKPRAVNGCVDLPALVAVAAAQADIPSAA